MVPQSILATAVGDDYLYVMGMKLLEGRDFSKEISTTSVICSKGDINESIPLLLQIK